MAVEKLKGIDAVEGDAFDKITRVGTTDLSFHDFG